LYFVTFTTHRNPQGKTKLVLPLKRDNVKKGKTNFPKAAVKFNDGMQQIPYWRHTIPECLWTFCFTWPFEFGACRL